ncbi:type II restriction enzyme [Mariniplasma anaerobium]|uniref:Type II restriction endonuclease n=1 Tax=Mariniplasma anaerobium TaxID=2735436 RepID=A0A7U9TJU6_9MOLU|nr:translation elongation factor [Mariniplasma anaerobium]BCR36671.1 hypothetical protein MPAN_015640 [Mariniplasma anaerobium]
MEKKTVSDYWNEIFEKYNILDEIKNHQVFKITAKQIKEFKEPRLMTKFDSRRSRPGIFRKNYLGILPIDNGEYLIGKFNLYEKVPKDPNLMPVEVDLPEYLESIDPDNIYSESNALNVALLSGMIRNLIGEDLHETISGRMRANDFDFIVHGSDNISQIINVKKPQIEIDGGYESKNKLILIEAKNTDPDDFIIRQLYYPYRFWTMKVNKSIVPIFFTYKNGLYDFYVYEFENEKDYNSIKFIEHISYKLRYKNLEIIKRENLIVIDEDMSIPFPQADSFTRIKGILDHLSDKDCTANDIAELFDFTPRQGAYYLAAARYLGLVEKENKLYQLTKAAYQINKFSVKERNVMLGEFILKHKPFLLVFDYYNRYKEFPSNEKIIEFMDISKINLPSKNRVVYERRASTVRGWVQWIIYSGIKVS